VGLDPRAVLAAGPASPQSALVMDAMGEIRPTYGPELIGQILGSGVNSVAVTLCDPKAQEQEAFDVALEGLLVHDRYIDSQPGLFVKATSIADVEVARRSGKLALFYFFQNSTHFGRDLERVELFYRLGLRSCQLTYNHQNWAGAGCKETAGSGLTVFGLELVESLNAARILIDLSHANTRTMTDAIAASKAPVVISHTGCMSVFENVRNTADEQLRAVADTGGVVGICQIRPFLTDLKAGSLDRYFDHIDHAVKVAGVEHVCIGSDRDHRVITMTPEYVAELKREEGPNFNDADWPLFIDELNGPRRMEVVWDGLVKRGYSEGQVEMVMGQNLHRV
jgi:membrane dipeptidase